MNSDIYDEESESSESGSTDHLESIKPERAFDIWLDRQSSTHAEATIESYEYRLEPFIEWCEENGIENLNSLSGRDIFEYDAYRRRTKDLKTSTLNNQLGTLRKFIRFCEQIGAVEEGLESKVEVPETSLAEKVNTDLLKANRAEELREKLDTYARASREQVIFELLWHTGCRVGGLHSLDLQDCYFDDEDIDRLRHEGDVDLDAVDDLSTPFIYFRHRPETETPLKNKESGERPVALSERVAQRVEEYIKVNRVDRTEECGREPLFTTKRGETARVSKSNIRRLLYVITQPCRWGSCPHGRDEAECKAREHGKESRCPSSKSPHPIRTGAVTRWRDQGWSPEMVGERVNASAETIKLHYDHPDPLRRMESRRQMIERGDSQ
ncbi:site-specific integrase [Salinarchaeum sp. IM2453]|uniref:tyrosine-type recombinase/integrase n=1 Tax=Salinarchaeum sp. IM2453 TaxID=2862870 RepID=UPI001C82FAB4|nr:site-specific integrase [Salinarchaeum sp. IM2453]QZA88390.1 site-specific integrase [Salinarchaeum sp. IM2453]